MRGTENDEKMIFSYYGKDAIKECVLNIRYFDKKTLNYLSIVFDIPKEQFRCYRQSLSENPFGIPGREEGYLRNETYGGCEQG
uniref:Uncharacterized protein n=1 Tax=uncultured bacterium contig00088 TaxID=1181561 RepID=A0A806K211_9BACT|nr:hypothetical protein [uncultured bacterium contig00088]